MNDDSNLAETQLTPTGSAPQAAKTDKKKPNRAAMRFTLIGLLGLLLIGAVSGFAGYSSGIGLRQQAAATQSAAQLQQQFDLGVQEMAEGSWDRARQRFEYIIRTDPSYPGAAEALAEALLRLNSTATPTVAPTPTVTPTPDTRGVDERFTQSQQTLANGDWTTTVNTLLELRKVDPNFRAVEIDGMLFMALRNRGIDKIGKEADLEGGLYDLSLAERFGLLDSEAHGYRNWARMYLIGASFWELNWEQVVANFEQISQQLPNLRDGSGMTSLERYRLGLIGWGDELAAAGECEAAAEKYELALAIADDQHAAEMLAEVTNACGGGDDVDEGSDGGEVPVEVTPTPQGELPPIETTAAPVEQPPTEAPPTEAPPTEPPPAEPPTPEPTPGS